MIPNWILPRSIHLYRILNTPVIKKKKWDHPFEITLNSPHIVVVSA